MTKSPTKYQKILINSNRNSDLQVMVVVAVAGAHTREIWSRLSLEIAVAIKIAVVDGALKSTSKNERKNSSK